ncbi:hypothetical protein [Hydrogenophaga sp.]|uniref:hypothetical protein n=1 Tax=Hydrogenophaga sp. TaxID=1904254 RepID=UPI0019B5535B|nr:hypothetical protein [Hydrogenophaga sp.]MBD3892436.1 hypothetical protein [Hydrogenophaga sp.]
MLQPKLDACTPAPHHVPRAVKRSDKSAALMVDPIKRIMKNQPPTPAAPPAPSEEVLLLHQIRDQLRR